jgi:hypothetical protein
MKRAAVQPADDERPFVEAAVDVAGRQPTRPGADREARAAEVLRLDGEQPVGDGDRVRGPLAAEELAREPRFDKVCRGPEAYVGTAGAMNSRP